METAGFSLLLPRVGNQKPQANAPVRQTGFRMRRPRSRQEAPCLRVKILQTAQQVSCKAYAVTSLEMAA